MTAYLTAAIMVHLLSISDLVVFRGCTCIINSINTELGYKIYTLTNLDTGYQHRAFHYELRKPDPAAGGIVDRLMDDDFVPDQPAPGPVRPAKTDNQRRFQPVTEDDLVLLEEKRTAQNTHVQTAWAVQVFRGKWYHVLLFCLHPTSWSVAVVNERCPHVSAVTGLRHAWSCIIETTWLYQPMRGEVTRGAHGGG